MLCNRHENGSIGMMPKKFFILFLLYIISNTSYAQPYVDIASFQGMMNRADDFMGEKPDTDINFFSAQVTYPHVFKDSSVFVISAGYENWYLKNTTGSLSLHTAFLPLTYVAKFSEKSKMSFTAIPRFNSETNTSVSGETMQYGGAVIYNHKINSSLSLKGGLYYNREFFGNYFLPLIGGEWKASERLYIFGLLPNILIADYRLTDFLHAGFIYKGVTASYRLNEDNASDYFRIQEGQAKLFADFYLTKNLVLNLEAGQTAERLYGYGLLNEDETEIEISEACLFKAGLYYRMWVGK
jgi:hypothetical protein